jgi:rsbT co-antagonist protein RsbR
VDEDKENPGEDIMAQEVLLETNVGIDRLKALMELYSFTHEDRKNVLFAGETLIPSLPEFVETFYEWQEKLPEFDHFFSDENLLRQVKGKQHQYWIEFFQAEMDDAYMENRETLGQTHARIGLSLNTYFASMNMACVLLIDILKENVKESSSASLIESLAKQIHLDTAIVADAYATVTYETAAAQSKSLMEMSTPVTQIWEGILLLPIVGIIDSKRAQDIMNAALVNISKTQAQVFIMDISGVGVVDTAVANHLIQITKATRLMGCEAVISGLSPAIAQTIVELGIDVGKVKTTATMRDALANAFHRLKMEIVSGV